MPALCSLDRHLADHAAADPLRGAVARSVTELSAAARELWDIARNGRDFSAVEPGTNADGDRQTKLDIVADRIFLQAARCSPVAAYGSEEQPDPVLLDSGAPLVLAIDPLDGSANVELDLSFSTIFSILPVLHAQADGPEAALLQPGERQIAAGMVIYGPRLSLVLSLGSGTFLFAFSPERDGFFGTGERITVPPRALEFAINASNYRHWHEAVRLYFDDCIKGVAGPRGRDFNMRWLASVGLEAHRILKRGGVYLYPADQRKGYGSGRLRLVYEANPLAFLIEQAGGRATNGTIPILTLRPESLHQRVPLVFGSAREVMLVARYHTDPSAIEDRAPLFGHRSLFRG
jgi:fructose-1,6-bisphosphatase I